MAANLATKIAEKLAITGTKWDNIDTGMIKNQIFQELSA